MKAETIQDLIVWQKAHKFVLAVYQLTASFPRNENYVLTSQMRRAAISIPANIAEGFKRRTRREKLRFMNIAEGSVEESKYFLILAGDLGYGETSTLKASLDEVARLLKGYTKPIIRKEFESRQMKTVSR